MLSALALAWRMAAVWAWTRTAAQFAALSRTWAPPSVTFEPDGKDAASAATPFWIIAVVGLLTVAMTDAFAVWAAPLRKGGVVMPLRATPARTRVSTTAATVASSILPPFRA